MTNEFDLSIREIDDLLEHLYLKLKGKREGLSLVEPATILLSYLKNANQSFYKPQLARFTPIIMDALIYEAYVSFGYEGLESLNDVAGDIALATGDYIPAGVEEGLSRIREEIDSISAILNGNNLAAGISADTPGKGETGTRGFFRERAWGTTGLPLVSIYNTGKIPFSTGRVVKARVEIRITGEWSIRTRRDPVINFEHISAEPNSPFERQIHTAVRIAEEYAAAAMGMGGIQRVPREYRISLPEIASFPSSAIQRLSGGSAGFAIGALLVSVLSRLDLYRYRLRVDPDIAITGTVDETGNILAVEDSHIADKVRAVFFSRFSKLILPAENLETAEKELAVLTQDHPSRKLDLESAADIADVFSDTGVISRSRVPVGKSVLQRMFLWRKHLLTAASLAALAIISILIIRPYYSRDIAEINAAGNRITIFNKFGRLITEHELKFTIPENQKINKRIFIGDFDGNGENEALCVLTDSRYLNPSSAYNRLHFIGFDNEGRYRASFIFDDEELLGDQMDPESSAFPVTITNHSRIFKDDLGKTRFLALAHHASRRPGSVINLSLKDLKGDVFLHQGFLFQMALTDIDKDGIEDIVLSGYNNILGCCMVVVLDQRQMNGSSPRGADYNLAGLEDIAKFYLRLPDFYRYLPLYSRSWLPLTTKVNNSRRGLIVTVHNPGNNVNFFLGDHMKCTRAEVLESKDEKAASRPGDPATFDYPGKKNDEAALRTGIRYWDGEEWVPDPTINRSYLEHSGIAVDNTITWIDHENANLLMKNAHGIVIATYDVGFELRKSSAYRKVIFGDFLEDDGGEILIAISNSWRFNKSDPDGNKLFILIFDEKGNLLRRHAYHEESVMGSEIDYASTRIGMQMIKSSSTFIEEFGPRWLFVGTHHKTEPPSSLIRFSLDDGSYETFFHKGILQEMAVRDIDGDGRSELLLTGYSISLDAAVIVVLDPNHVGGSSPQEACYKVPGSDRDIAKYYIKLPFYHRSERYVSRAWSLHPRIFENSDRLRIIVRSRSKEVIYTIEDGMIFSEAEVVELIKGSSGKLDSLAYLSFPEKEEEEKDLLNGIRFWDGNDWVAEPTVNRSYLRIVKAHNDTMAGKSK